MKRKITKQKRNPDLSSSGQSITPEWTKILINDLCVINSLENIEWHNPVQIEICELCGISGCNSNGNVWIFKVNDLVMFSEPSAIEISHIISSSIIENSRIYFTKNEWNEYFENQKNTLKFNDISNAKRWNIYSFILLNSPIKGLQSISKIKEIILDQIIYIENFDKDLFIEYMNEFNNINEYDKEIKQNEIYQLTNEYLEVVIYLDNGDEWKNFKSKNNELFYSIWNDYLWKFHLTTAST